MLRAHLRLDDSDPFWFWMASSYQPDFVEDLKATVPYQQRSWHPQSKRWRVAMSVHADVCELLAQHRYTVRDDTAPPQSVVPASDMPDDLRQAMARLYLDALAPVGVAEAVFKHLAKIHHPDHGGHIDDFKEINHAIERIRYYANLGRENP